MAVNSDNRLIGCDETVSAAWGLQIVISKLKTRLWQKESQQHPLMKGKSATEHAPLIAAWQPDSR